MNHDCFIFDLDGTLLDTLPDLVVLTNAVLREFDMSERSTEEILSYVGNGARALIYQAVPENTPHPIAEQALARWKSLYTSLGHKDTKPYPGIPQVLAELQRRGVALGVVSNKFDAATYQVITQHFPGVFGAIHGETPDYPRKPDPTSLLRTIDELGSTPARSVYVGDTPDDMQTARNAGTFALAVDWGYRPIVDIQQVGYDALIGKPSQLLDFASY